MNVIVNENDDNDDADVDDKSDSKMMKVKICLIHVDDFRGISISPVLSKIFEHCIL